MINTKGINEEFELNKFLHHSAPHNVDEQTMNEVFMKNMITSCYTYGGAEKSSYNFKNYIQKYRDKLTEEVFEEVYEEQMQYLKDFVVHNAVYSDSEGGRYNSLQKI